MERRAGGSCSLLRLVVTWRSSEMARENLQLGKLYLSPWALPGGGRWRQEGQEGRWRWWRWLPETERCVFSFLLKGLSPMGMGLRPSTALLGAGSRWAACPGQAACRDGNSPCTPGVLTNAGLLWIFCPPYFSGQCSCSDTCFFPPGYL